MKYNPLLVNMIDEDYDKLWTRRLLENGIWYSGDEQALRYFYTKEAPKFYRFGEPSESLNYFWANTEKDFRKVHTGFPQLISEKMADLITGNGYAMIVEGENEEEHQEDLDEVLEDNSFNTLINKSIETESFGGGVAWKLSKNPLVSDYPIIEMWQPENYDNVVISGRIVEDIFYKYYEHNNTTYRLSERYGVDDKGAYIDYKLEQLVYQQLGQEKIEERYVEVALTELEETQELRRIEFIGYFKRLSLYKPNKLPNSEFRWSVLGESDYSGSYGAFDSIDEAWSTSVQEGRDGKLTRYFPEDYLPKNAKGDTYFPDDFKVKHIIYKDSPSDNVDKSKIQYAQGELRTDQRLEQYKAAVMLALNNAGLSPLTVGITGFESIDASAESQQEREKVSIRTRNKKIGLWKEHLAKFLPITMDFHYITQQSPVMVKNVIRYVVGALPEIEIIPTFEDYIIKSMKDRTSEVAEGFGTSWDILTAVQYVHKDKTAREQLAISARIKIENGIDSLSTAEASALQDMNREDEEALVEEGVTLIEQEDGQETEDGVVIEEIDNEPPEGDTQEEEDSQ